MTVREKMNRILQNGTDYIDCGEYHIDGRTHGFLQNSSNGNIKVVYESKDDIDDDGNPTTQVSDYKNLKELLGDFTLSF